MARAHAVPSSVALVVVKIVKGARSPQKAFGRTVGFPADVVNVRNHPVPEVAYKKGTSIIFQ